MVKTVIANPPLGIYKNPDITIGQATYMVPLDANARVRKDLLFEEVSFPVYAFNVYGRGGDLLDDPQKNADEYRTRQSLRERLSFSSNERISDDEEVIVKGSQRDFERLNERGYLIKAGERFFLDCMRIKHDFSLENLLIGVKTDERAMKTIERYWAENMDIPHPITKPTKFSVNNPLGGEKIGPLFTLANLWGHRYPGYEVIMAGSERNLTNYIFLRILTQLALNGGLGMNEVYVYPQIDFAEGIERWSLRGLTEEEFASDVLRYALLSVRPKGGKGKIDYPRLDEGRKFVNLIGNLGRVLTYTPQDPTGKEEVISHAINFNLSLYVGKLRRKLGNLSERVKDSKSCGRFEKEKNTFSVEYSQLLNETKIISPKISDREMKKWT